MRKLNGADSRGSENNCVEPTHSKVSDPKGSENQLINQSFLCLPTEPGVESQGWESESGGDKEFIGNCDVFRVVSFFT